MDLADEDVESYDEVDNSVQLEGCRPDLQVGDVRIKIPGTLADFAVTKFLGSGGQGAVLAGVDSDGTPGVLKVAGGRCRRAVGPMPPSWSRSPTPSGGLDLKAALLFEERVKVFATSLREIPGVVPPARAGRFKGTSVVWLWSKDTTAAQKKTLDAWFEALLRERMRSGRPADAYQRFARVMARVARTMDRAHARGIVHRDLKPANILVSDEKDEVTVIDFDLAYFLDETLRLNRSPRAGTRGFRAPEQARGQRIVPATDVAGIGGTTFAVLTGLEVRWEAPSPSLYGSPPGCPKGLLTGLDAICRRTLDLDPARRGTMQQLAEDLERAARGETVEPPVATLSTSADASTRQRRVSLLVLKGLVAATMLVTAQHLVARPPTSSSHDLRERAAAEERAGERRARLAELEGELERSREATRSAWHEIAMREKTLDDQRRSAAVLELQLASVSRRATEGEAHLTNLLAARVEVPSIADKGDNLAQKHAKCEVELAETKAKARSEEHRAATLAGELSQAKVATAASEVECSRLTGELASTKKRLALAETEVGLQTTRQAALVKDAKALKRRINETERELLRARANPSGGTGSRDPAAETFNLDRNYRR